MNIGFLPLPVDPISKAMTHPLRSATLATPLRSSHSRPRHKHVEPRSRYRREFAAWPEQVSFFLARLSFAPPPCRMPLGQSQCIPQADPRGMATPWFWHRLIGFRHFCSGSLALASLKLACRNLVPTFPQRSPPSLLTTAACGGLRSTPNCRPRRGDSTSRKPLAREVRAGAADVAASSRAGRKTERNLFTRPSRADRLRNPALGSCR